MNYEKTTNLVPKILSWIILALGIWALVNRNSFLDLLDQADVRIISHFWKLFILLMQESSHVLSGISFHPFCTHLVFHIFWKWGIIVAATHLMQKKRTSSKSNQVSVSIYESAVILFLIVACVAILVSCLGCCGAYKEIKWMLTVVRLCYLMWKPCLMLVFSRMLFFSEVLCGGPWLVRETISKWKFWRWKMTYLLHSLLWWSFACDRYHFFLDILMIENYHCFSEVLCGGPWPPRSHSHWHHHRHDSGKAYLHFYWHLISWSYISISAFCIRSLKIDFSNVCVGYFLALQFDKFMFLFFDSYWPHIIQGLNSFKRNRSWNH